MADDTVDPSIVRFSEVLLLALSSGVTHGPQQLKDGLLEEFRRGALQRGSEFRLDVIV